MLRKLIVLCCCFSFALISCNQQSENMKEGTYGRDKEFLEKNDVSYIELQNKDDGPALLIVPAWQGRVMTSSSSGDDGLSYGWINHDFISKGEKSNQFNVYGGEERFWLGPEGGNYSLYFGEGQEQVFENWKVPVFIDTDEYPIINQTDNEVIFEKSASLKNASGYTFDLNIKRKVKLLDDKAIVASLGLESVHGLECMGYLTENKLSNEGEEAWVKDKGLISVWLLCMFAPSPTTTVFIPYNDSEDLEGVTIVNDEYFGKVPEDRLIKKEGVIYFKIDGKYRSKIGVPKGRAGNICGSYDSSSGVLTILKINTPENDSPYVNGNWGEQDDPFSGDVLNSYNDGPVEDGSIMGPFYEIESSSPGAELSPGESIVHKQQIYHFKGDETELELIVKSIFGLSLSGIKAIF